VPGGGGVRLGVGWGWGLRLDGGKDGLVSKIKVLFQNKKVGVQHKDHECMHSIYFITTF
jgi:hypothetical protein